MTRKEALEEQTIEAFVVKRKDPTAELEFSEDDGATWRLGHGSSIVNPRIHYRIKPTPKKKRVPLTRDDMPVAFVVRVLGDRSKEDYALRRTSVDGLACDLFSWSWDVLASNPLFQYSTDRKTWLPFYKEVEE